MTFSKDLVVNEFIKQIIQQYSKRYPILPATISELQRHMKLLEYSKNHVLIKEGHRHDFVYYMIEGAARSYYLKDGNEVNTWFAFENDLIGSLNNYRDLPSRETVELLEDSTLISVNMQTLKPLAYSQLQISNFIGEVIEEYAGFLEDRIFFSQFMSSMERYQLLLKHEPLALQRVPLTYIASYLGISRETLSRLRAK